MRKSTVCRYFAVGFGHEVVKRFSEGICLKKPAAMGEHPPDIFPLRLGAHFLEISIRTLSIVSV